MTQRTENVVDLKSAWTCGRLLKRGTLHTGVSNGKLWKRQEILIATEERIPQQLCFHCFGEAVERMDKVGIDELVWLNFRAECNEWNEKFYMRFVVNGIFSPEEFHAERY